MGQQGVRFFWRTAQPRVRLKCTHSGSPHSTQQCSISVQKPSITSSSSTLQATPLTPSLHSRTDMRSLEESEQCSAGISGGMPLLPLCSANQAQAEHVHSVQHRSVVTLQGPSATAIAQPVLCATRSFCLRCRQPRAPSCPSAHCSATARKRQVGDRRVARREQQKRVSIHTHSSRAIAAAVWSALTAILLL